MGRMHLVELEDLSWFPATIRDAATTYLSTVVRLTGQLRSFTPKIKEGLARANASQVVDLCSGAGGPALAMADMEELGEGKPISLTLTDLYPNKAGEDRVQRSGAKHVTYYPRSVDATRVPSELQGMRTVFNAFHHFRPEVARRIIASAVEDRAAIGIFEFVERSVPAFIGMLFAPIFCLLVMPLVRPIKFSWLFFTYIVPLIPFVVLWDGVVSSLRIYSPNELRDLVRDVPGNETFEWDIGTVAMGSGPMRGTYLVGIPKKVSD